MKRIRTAFTLIELLTVVAITALLLTIIVVPVIQSFNLTRTAQAYSDAQDRARLLAEKVSREINNSMGLRDLSTYVTATINGVSQQVQANNIAIVVPSVNTNGTVATNPTPVQVLLPYAKVDIVEPAQGAPDPTLAPGSYRDPRTGFIDPTLQAPKGQVSLPVTQGPTIVRYWIGLRAPLTSDGLHSQRYNDPYSGLLMSVGGSRDNLYVLYRAEIQPMVFRTTPGAAAGSPGSVNMLRPNLKYFQADPTDTQIIDEDDPSFFSLIPTVDVSSEATGALTASGAAKAARITNWMKASTLQSEVSRYDLILPVYDKSSRKVANSNGVPQILPMAQFRPQRITQETVAGQTASRLGDENSSGAAIAPDTLTTQYGEWSNAVVRTYPIGWTGSTAPYEVGRRDPTLGNAIFGFTPSLGTEDTTGGTMLFSLDTYENVVSSGGLYPFSQAVDAGNWLTTASPWRSVFTPYSMNRVTGKIITSFGINEVGNPSDTPPANDPNNLPVINTTTDGNAYTASNDPTVSTGVFSDAAFNSINERFNKVWNDFPELRPDIHRFVDLRVSLQGDGSHSPLYPDPLNGEPTGMGRLVDSNGYTRFSKASIVPGSEQVIGPDQLPGPNYGLAVRYTRTVGTPGPNQYKINYTDLGEPVDQNNNLAYAQAFPTVPGITNPQTTYTPTDFVTAVLQPRYKAGYVQFCSDPNIPLPNGTITISYRFQISSKLAGSLASLSQAGANNSDTFSVDYDSRDLVNVLFTVRNYPQASLVPNPQTVTLKATAAVRNYLR